MPAFYCVTCGAQFPDSQQPPAACPVCQDERQYVAYDGQRWTTLDALRSEHSSRIEEQEPGLVGIGMEPSFGIGQRALLMGRLLWDCIPLVDDDIATAVGEFGGIETIAVSHPHFYTGMVEWATEFDARILLHEADRDWVTRPDDCIEFWTGDRYVISDDLLLVRLGGHFPGGTVCLWRSGAGGEGALLTGDIVHVVADRDWVSFMWSYPNLVPLPPNEVRRIAQVLETLSFDRIYGGWWDRVIHDGAKGKVQRSAARYMRASAEVLG